MTTYDLILAFVKRQRRIPSADTQYDSSIADSINSAYRTYCRKFQSLYAPGIRGTATITLSANTQDYNLAADFDRLIDDSVKYYTSNQEDYQIIPIVLGPDAEIYESMEETYSPLACRVIAGSTGTQRKLRLLPAFSQTGYTVTYSYWKRPATLTTGVTLELPELGDAVGWNAVAASYDYFRDANGDNAQVMAMARAKEAYQEAYGTLNY